MRKFILGALLLGAAYWGIKQYNKQKNDTLPPVPAQPKANPSPKTVDDPLVRYDNRIVEDAKGYWMLIKGGMIYTPTNLDSIKAYQTANPEYAEVLKVPESIWETYNVPGSTVIGGSF